MAIYCYTMDKGIPLLGCIPSCYAGYMVHQDFKEAVQYARILLGNVSSALPSSSPTPPRYRRRKGGKEGKTK